MSPRAKLSVLTVVEQFWHKVPGGVAVSTADAIDAMSQSIDFTGVAAWHRSKTVSQPRVFPDSWAESAPIKHLKLPRPILYENWLANRPPKVGDSSTDLVWASSMVVPTTDLPVVTTINDIDFFSNPETLSKRGKDFFPRAWSRAATASDVIVCPTDHVATAVAERLTSDGATQPPIEVIPWAVKPNDGHIGQPELLEGLELEDKFFLWVGTLEPRKNLRTLIEAFLASEASQLVVVGPTGWGEQVDNLDPSRIHFCGYVSDEMLEELYRAAYGFVFPSISEGFGLPLLEAMSRGLPIICSNTSVMPEVVGPAGLMFDPHSATELTKAINKLNSSSELAAEMSAASSQQAGLFSWARTAKSYEEVFRSVIG